MEIHSTAHFERSPEHAGLKMLNKLPTDQKTIVNVGLFRNKLKSISFNGKSILFD